MKRLLSYVFCMSLKCIVINDKLNCTNYGGIKDGNDDKF